MATQARVQSAPVARPLWQRSLWLLGVVVALALLTSLARALPLLSDSFPTSWNFGLRPVIDDLQDWVVGNRGTSPLFVYFFDPLSDMIDTGLRAVEGLLLGLPWVAVVGAFALAGYLLSGVRLATLCAVGLLLIGLFGLWEQGMQTLALMGVSVLLALLLGIPLGIAAARNDRLDRVLRPVLDAMQTMPAFVYLIPVVLFFGIARVPAVVATLIYAVPPIVRLTNLGIREVSPPAVEAARAFGATNRQLLWQVQLPLALPAMLAGVNQTIMMALSMVVIAAMIGAGGLGREVLVALQRLQVGQALEAGLAIVFLAVILDRLSAALGRLDLGPRAPGQPGSSRRKPLLVGLGLLVALGVAGWLVPALGAFPEDWRVSLRAPTDAAVAWMRDNLYRIGDTPFGTGPFSDAVTIYLLNPLRSLLTTGLPWPVVILIVAALGLRAGGWQLGLWSGLGFFAIGMLGMWEPGMDTLSQVLVTMLFTVALALPLGILAAQRPFLGALIRPVLDFLQTIPTFVYLVPVIMLFNVGRVPGLIAAVLYAIPPGIKLVELGIRSVPSDTTEASRSFGATKRQTLWGVQLPLARNSIMLGVNQMLLMVLAMVVIAGLVGGAGLGLEAVTGLARNQTGRGIEAGLAIVVMAIVLDRITQAWATRNV
jgi:glycine betaine/proline transport system permease protein